MQLPLGPLIARLWKAQWRTIAAVTSLLALGVLDYTFVRVQIAPLAILPLLLLGYYQGLRTALVGAIITALCFGYIDYTPISGGRVAIGSLPVDTIALAIAFCAAVVLSSILQRESSLRLAMSARLQSTRKGESDARKAARTDPLTEVMNRLGFDETIADVIVGCKKGHTAVLMFLDLDRFKNINDEHGHNVGDAVLRTVARRLRTSVREDDTVARLGGDEFAIICTGPSGLQTRTESICKHLEHAFEDPILANGISFRVELSVGIAACPEEADSVESLLRLADRRMYENKRGRRTVALE
jgi:diguanylate cyclase (GGDEF)-like protein